MINGTKSFQKNNNHLMEKHSKENENIKSFGSSLYTETKEGKMDIGIVYLPGSSGKLISNVWLKTVLRVGGRKRLKSPFLVCISLILQIHWKYLER